MSDDADFGADQRHRLRLRFGAVAELYDRARPQYAPEAVRWALDGHVHALDLAAGTGKLTAMLVAAGAEVVAVEPSEPMLGVLRSNLPTVDARLGSAEATGLPDASVDAVTIGSALHWFDRPAADREIARVLRRGGVVAAMHNGRDASVPWVAALEELLGDRTSMRRVGRSETRRQHSLDRQLFGAPESAQFPFTQVLDADALAELFASRSYVIDLDESDRATLLDDIRTLARTHPDLAGRDRFELPYLTVVTRQVRD